MGKQNTLEKYALILNIHHKLLQNVNICSITRGVQLNAIGGQQNRRDVMNVMKHHCCHGDQRTPLIQNGCRKCRRLDR
jgi:hypothetical protein